MQRVVARSSFKSILTLRLPGGRDEDEHQQKRKYGAFLNKDKEDEEMKKTRENVPSMVQMRDMLLGHENRSIFWSFYGLGQWHCEDN
ncbi:hypothetical protein LXL04_005101 [Taraxacum kok-saghyz]